VYSRSSRFFNLTAVVVGLGLTAIQANAQQAMFHLPVEAHWGTAVLEPGDYRLSVPVGDSPSHIIRVFSSTKGSMVVPDQTDYQKPVGHGQLELVKINDAYFVRKYQSGSTGTVFTFAVPKATREVQLSSATTEIPVNEGTK